MKRLVAGFLFAALLPAAALAAEPAPDAALRKFFDRVFQEDLRENPELATVVGVEGGNDKLADRSAAATERRKARVKARIAELRRFDPARLNTQDRISREVMLDGLGREDRINAIFGKLPFGADDLDNWLIASPIQGIQDWFGYLAKAAPTRNAKDYEDYLKRVDAIPAALSQLTARLRVGMTSGWMPPRAVMASVAPQIQVFAQGEPEHSPLFVPFKEFPATIPAAEQQRLAAAGKQAITARVQPAFAAFQRFVEAEYIPAAPEALAFTQRPAGAKGYELAIEAYTTTTLTAQQIHDTGLAEVARIRAEMEKVIASTGFKGTFAEFQQFLREDPRFYFTKPDDMLTAYRDMAKRADAELPRFFAELPRLPYGIRAMDAHEGDNSDHYSRGRARRQPRRLLRGQRQQPREAPEVRHGIHAAARGGAGPPPADRARPGAAGLPEFRRAGWYTAYARAGRCTPRASATRWASTRTRTSASAALQRDAARLPPGDRHRHARDGLDARAVDPLPARQHRLARATPRRSRPLHRLARPGARLQGRRAAHQGAAREGDGRARRSLRPPPLPQRDPRRRRAAAHRARGAHRRMDRTAEKGKQAMRTLDRSRGAGRAARTARRISPRSRSRPTKLNDTPTCWWARAATSGSRSATTRSSSIDDQFAPLAPKIEARSPRSRPSR
jgi:uncharacterized protein (DUF885 family)